MQVKIKKLTMSAIIPTQAHITDAGFDIYADITDNKEWITIQPNSNCMINTGVSLEIPIGYWGAIYARSGKAAKEGLRPSNCVGVIDADFRGEIKVSLYNDSDFDRRVYPGDKIAQLIIHKQENVELIEVDKLSDTERGTGGFGSSGR